MRSFVLCTASAVALSVSAIAAPAFAAEAPPPTPPAQPAEQPTSDQTTSVGTGATDSDADIVVTARHRNESSQGVPVAISVVGGDHIDSTGAFNVGRLQQLTPTLQFYSSNPRNTSVNVRGFGSPLGLTNDGIDQGVGIYVDDVYYSRVASSTFDFLDVKQIEVLRGPQGTLYGKNTTAGAINITSRQPTFDLEGRAEVSAGNYGYAQFKGAISGPLSDTVAVRLAMSETRRNGTISNITPGQKDNNLSNLGLRAQVLWKPTSTLEVSLAGDYNHQNIVCCATVFVKNVQTQKALNRQYAAISAVQGYALPGIAQNHYNRISDVDALLRARQSIGGASLRARLDLGAGTLTSIHRLPLLGLGSVERPRFHRPADHHGEPKPVEAAPVHAGIALQPA
jgi:iron complex outermembrane receptor protein